MIRNRENVRVLVCPGFHDPSVTQAGVAILQAQRTIPPSQWWIVPTATIPPYAGVEIVQFLHQQRVSSHPSPLPTLVILGFSAGVVGAIGAAHLWQQQGGTVQRLIAVDGWGVPLWGHFPIDRLSHDAFTCLTSHVLGAGQAGFYADPPVAHLDLWRSPHQVTGWALAYPRGWPWVSQRSRTTAAEFIASRLL